MQIAQQLGIERASICYRVAELRDEGKLWVIGKGLDPITKKRAEFLTCNPAIAMNRAIQKEVEQKERLF